MMESTGPTSGVRRATSAPFPQGAKDLCQLGNAVPRNSSVAYVASKANASAPRRRSSKSLDRSDHSGSMDDGVNVREVESSSSTNNESSSSQRRRSSSFLRQFGHHATEEASSAPKRRSFKPLGRSKSTPLDDIFFFKVDQSSSTNPSSGRRTRRDSSVLPHEDEFPQTAEASWSTPQRQGRSFKQLERSERSSVDQDCLVHVELSSNTADSGPTRRNSSSSFLQGCSSPTDDECPHQSIIPSWSTPRRRSSNVFRRSNSNPMDEDLTNDTATPSPQRRPPVFSRSCDDSQLLSLQESQKLLLAGQASTANAKAPRGIKDHVFLKPVDAESTMNTELTKQGDANTAMPYKVQPRFCWLVSGLCIVMMLVMMKRENLYFWGGHHNKPTTVAAAAPVLFASPLTSARRVACIDRQLSVRRSFQERHWKVQEIRTRHYIPDIQHCVAQGQAEIVWTKYNPSAAVWKAAKPWQRWNWLPFQDIMSVKSSWIEGLRDHAAKTGENIDFIPDSYVLPRDRDALLERMKGETVSLPGSGGGGKKEPWVVKLSDVDNGMGISMLGPSSPELDSLVEILQKDSSAGLTRAIPEIREQIVLGKRSDMDKAQIQQVHQESKARNDNVIVQRYVCNELSFHRNKFDLRLYFLVASVKPLVVLYHDGFLRVSSAKYQESNFSSHLHLTNIGRNKLTDGSINNNSTVMFEEFSDYLEEYVANVVAAGAGATALLPEHVRQDPLGHIRRQIKAALAVTIASVRETAFGGHDDSNENANNNNSAGSETRSRAGYNVTRMQDGFTLMAGDFIVDRDLTVWMTEAQSSPGLGNETPKKSVLFDRMLQSVVDIVEHITLKQRAGEAVLPSLLSSNVNVLGEFELIYTDEFQYRYSNVTRRKNTCAGGGSKRSKR